MKRKALLIIMPGVKGSKQHLPSTITDEKNYRSFLINSIGGEWLNSEIDTLKDPSKKDVFDAVKNIQADYTFTLFCGHGGENTSDGKMYFDVMDGDLPIDNLINNSKRQTIILDTCRTLYTPKEEGTLIKAYSESFEHPIYGARQTFDDYLQICEEGIIKIFSSSKGQSADDSEQFGGNFSYSLITAGLEWGKTNGRGADNHILDLFDATEQTRIMLQKYDTIQSPEYIGGRRKNHYPLAVRNIMINS